MACLIITSGQQAGVQFRLSKRPLFGGRDPRRDIQIVDESVGRKHFQVRHEAGAYIIIDLGSKNGTFVNGEKTTEKRLQDGDQIWVGNSTLTFSEGNRADQTDAVFKRKENRPSLRDGPTITGP